MVNMINYYVSVTEQCEPMYNLLSPNTPPGSHAPILQNNKGKN